MNFEENGLQAACIQASRCYPDIFVFHVKNEGRATIQARMRATALGVRAGVPDLVVMIRGGLTGYIELKTATGKLSEAQERFRDRCKDWDVPWALCRTVEEFQITVEAWVEMAAMPPRIAAIASDRG